MPVLIILVTLLGIAVLLSILGMVAEQQSAVRTVLRRIELLSHPQRGRLGVWLAKDRRVSPLVRYLPLTAFVYWIIPFDFIPDFIPKVGRFDDRVALALAFWCVLAVAPARLEEHLTRVEYLREVEEARLDELPPEGAPGPAGDA
jgi:uncharacterized membrane protein YkvA (DUF1232 family)